MSDLTRKTLDKMADWIIRKSCDDICKICAYYDEEAQAIEYDKDNTIDPCIHCRNKGESACKTGVIGYFMRKVENER